MLRKALSDNVDREDGHKDDAFKSHILMYLQYLKHLLFATL